MVSKQHIRQLCADNKEAVVDTIKHLVSTPSVVNIDSTEGISAKVSEIAQKLGFNTIFLDNPETDERAVFVGDNFDEKKGLLFTTSFSTVDLEDGASSKYDPFTPVLDGKLLYGSGAWKNKGNVALTLFVKKILTELGHGDKVKMLYSAETGYNVYTGIQYALKKGLQGEVQVVSGPVTFDTDGKALIYTGCRGFLRYKITFKKLSPDVLPEIWQKTSTLHNPIDIVNDYWERMQSGFGENTPDPSFPANTGNDQVMLGINGGRGTSIPTVASAVISMRSVFNITNEEYLMFVNNAAEQAIKGKPFTFEVEVICKFPAVQLPDNKFTQLHKANLEEIFDYEGKYVNDFYLDAISLFVDHGWECAYALSLTGKNQNSFDEYVDTSDLDKYLLADVLAVLDYYDIEVGD